MADESETKERNLKKRTVKSKEKYERKEINLRERNKNTNMGIL